MQKMPVRMTTNQSDNFWIYNYKSGVIGSRLECF
jgi:hypothetical protein